MSVSYKKLQDLFSGSELFGTEEIAYHSIVTDNKYMAELGLSVFTTGQLYSWLTRKNSQGEFINLKLIGDADFSPLKPGEKDEDRVKDYGSIMLGSQLCSSEAGGSVGDTYFFSPWRNVNLTGDYIKYNYSDWDFYNKYSFPDINFEWFKDKNIFIAKNSGEYNLAWTTDNKHLDYNISNFITMNDYARLLPAIKNESQYGEEELARSDFVLDVKTSLEKCIEWSGVINFRLNLGVETTEGNESCEKSECVRFKLFLYDSYVNKNASRSIAFNNLLISSTHIDQFGRVGRKDGTGEWQIPGIETNPANGIAGEVALNYSQSDGKFYSGTPQIIAVLSEDLPAATQPTIEDIENNPISSKEPNGILNSYNAWKPSFAKAIPIQSQNGNPLQWAPQYEKEKSCRQDSTKKYSITVTNMSPKRSFSRGDAIVVNKIDGHWIASSFGEQAQTTGLSRKLNWSFTYLLMNFDNFFRNKDNQIFDTVDYESRFYNYYYGLNNPNADSIAIYKPIQITSWDFMGVNIGGLRNSNALSTTLFGYNSRGDSWADYENGAYSAPFFGCVFPNGYNSPDKYFTYQSSHPALTIRNHTEYEPFFRNIDENVNVFLNNNDNNNPDNNNLGMFVLPDDPSLKHLPADIALNASLTGENGSPLQDQTYLYNLDPYLNNFCSGCEPVATGEPFQNQVKQIFEEEQSDNYQKRFAWIYDSSQEDKLLSAFDFEPVNSYVIQFRPLKAEIYGVFDPQPPTGDYGRFASTAIGLTVSKTKPIYDGILNRGETASMTVGNKLRYNKNLLHYIDLNTDARFPTPNWDEDWMVKNNPAPGGAFGVIGAVCTIQAKESIKFKTDNVIGMRSWFGIGARPWYPSLGGAGNDYDSYQNTQLFVRVFHSWPRSQTIFDPSTFAVFHFNKDGNYSQQDDSDLDFYEYTLDLGTKIFKDGALVGESILPNIGENKIISRRGKLLPYKYRIEKTMGIPPLSGDAVYIQGELEADPTARQYNLLISNRGSGYKTTDKFIISGGSGKTPYLKPIINEDGGIIGFEFIQDDTLQERPTHSGYDYKQEDFSNSTEDLSSGTTSKLVVKAQTVSGTGFSGYVMAGQIVQSPILTDEKPKKVGDSFIRLTPTVNTGSSDSNDVVPEITDSYETDVFITDKSSDEKYDLFFHFHNDISHTFISSYGGGAPAPLENHVTLTINPI